MEHQTHVISTTASKQFTYMRALLTLGVLVLLLTIVGGYIYFGMQLAQKTELPAEPVLVEAPVLDTTQIIFDALGANPPLPVSQAEVDAVNAALKEMPL